MPSSEWSVSPMNWQRSPAALGDQALQITAPPAGRSGTLSRWRVAWKPVESYLLRGPDTRTDPDNLPVTEEGAGRLPTVACWKRPDRAEPLEGGDGPRSFGRRAEMLMTMLDHR